MVSYLRVASHEMTFKQAATAMSSKPVTIGSYFRSVQQGKENIRSSIKTVIIALWLGLVREEELRRLLDQVSKGFLGLEEEERDRVATLIEALVSRIVM